MTIDGVCDHTAVSPDEEIHDHYRDLLDEGGVILYGRKTYDLMQYWQELLKKPSGEKSMDEFAAAIDNIPKIVFSNTLSTTGWNSATLATASPAETVQQLRQQPGKDIFIGSPGLINELTNLSLIDEYQLCIHPVVAGKGALLFKDITDSKKFSLLKTKAFISGPVILYYTPA